MGNNERGDRSGKLLTMVIPPQHNRVTGSEHSMRLDNEVYGKMSGSIDNSNYVIDNQKCNIASNLALQTDGMSQDDEKRRLRASIAELKQQVQRQQQAAQEDEKLRQLRREHEALQEQLQVGTSEGMGISDFKHCEKSSKPQKSVVKSGNESMTQQAERLQALTGVKFDMTGFINKNTRASPEEIDSVLRIVDSKQKVRTLGKHKGAETYLSAANHSGKQVKKDDIGSESENDDGSESDSDVQEVEDGGVGAKRKGKVHSGLYERPGDTKLVSTEWYAHTALNKALGGGA